VLNNPVLLREFLTSLRTRRALILAVLFLLCLSALVMLMWPSQGVYTMAARSSHKLFITLSVALLTLVCLCAPAFTAVSITREKELRTYDFLYHTLLRPSQIITGKFVAGVGFVMILIVGSLPMMGVCFILGGVSPMDVGKVYLIVVLSGVFIGLLGLFCSAFSRSSFRALIVCYVLILSICGLVWVPSVVLGLWAESVHAIHLVRGLSPFAALVSVINPDMFAGEHPVATSEFGTFADSMWVFGSFAGAGILLVFLITFIRVLRPPQPRTRQNTALIEDRIELIKRHLKWPFYLLDPRKRKRMIGRILNVIFVKEMRSKAFGRIAWVIRSMYMALVVSLVLAFLPLTQITKIGIETIIITCVALPLGMIILMSPVLTATAISEEDEKGVFDMLRCTMIKASTLANGKLEVAWFFIGLILASTFPTFFVLSYVSANPTDMEHLSEGINLIRPFNFKFAEGWEHLAQVDLQFLWEMLSAFSVVVVAMVFATVVGMTASAYSRKSSTSTAVAYSVVLLWSVGTLIPHFIADNLPAPVVRWFLTLNPFVAASTAVSTEVFVNLPSRLWMQNITLTLGAALVLYLATVFRVWRRMKPST